MKRRGRYYSSEHAVVVYVDERDFKLPSPVTLTEEALAALRAGDDLRNAANVKFWAKHDPSTSFVDDPKAAMLRDSQRIVLRNAMEEAMQRARTASHKSIAERNARNSEAATISRRLAGNRTRNLVREEAERVLAKKPGISLTKLGQEIASELVRSGSVGRLGAEHARALLCDLGITGRKKNRSRNRAVPPEQFR